MDLPQDTDLTDQTQVNRHLLTQGKLDPAPYGGQGQTMGILIICKVLLIK